MTSANRASQNGAYLKPVLVIGDVCVDLRIETPIHLGDHPQNPEPELLGGGTGANVAVALARLGVPTTFIGTVGDDGYGRFAVDGLRAEGIGTDYIYSVRDAFTTIVLGLVQPTGERTLFGWPTRGAAHTRLRAAQITEELVASAAWVHTTGLCLIEPPVSAALLSSMAMARAQGIPISLDLNLRLGYADGQLPSAYLATVKQAIKLSDYVFGSAEDEIPLLTSTGTLEDALMLLADRECVLIARQGVDGARAVWQDGSVLQPAFRVPVVDTTGAGDVFNAGFIYARLQGKDLAEALRWGEWGCRTPRLARKAHVRHQRAQRLKGCWRRRHKREAMIVRHSISADQYRIVPYR